MFEEGYTLVFITDPLYHVGIMSEDDQIKLTEKIIDLYDKSKMIIRPHPVDKIRYEELFPECKVLRERFPFEIFIWDTLEKCEKFIVYLYDDNLDRHFITGLVPRDIVDYYDLNGIAIE